MKSAAASAIGIFGLLIWASADATPSFSAAAGQRLSATNGPSFCPSLPGDSSSPASCFTPINVVNGIGSGSANSQASKGSVSAKLEITASNSPFQGIGSATIAGGYARARAVFDDLIISGPGQAAEVQLTANFSVDGSWVFLPGIGAGGIVQGDISIEIFDPLLEGKYEFDIASSNFVNTSAEIPLLELSTGVPLTVEMFINVEAELGDTFTFDEAFPPFMPNKTFLLADFGNTVSFAKSGPVFDLPAGYTLNSESANIVNNRWLGAVSVPTPAPIYGVALGLFGLMNWRTRKQSVPTAAKFLVG